MTATAHVTTFLSCGNGLQNASSQVETRGSCPNSRFFEEYSSYKSRNSSSEIMFLRNKAKKLNSNLRKAFSTELFCFRSWCFHVVLLNDLHFALKPRPRWSSALPAMPFVNQERLVFKFPIILEGLTSIELVKKFSHSWAVVLPKYSGRSFGLLGRAGKTPELKRPTTG